MVLGSTAPGTSGIPGIGVFLHGGAFNPWAENVTKDVHFKAEMPLSGLFLALVLFILARVFREGTRMREDLEGTV